MSQTRKSEKEFESEITGEQYIASDHIVYACLLYTSYPAADLNNPYELDDWSKEQLAQYTPDTEEYAEQESQLRQQLWNNKCVSYLYEPGSTFKIVTAAMAFEEKATTDSDTCLLYTSRCV